AFLHACATGDLETMRKWIARGVDVNMPEAREHKPLALALDNNQLKAMELLLQNKADPDILYITEPMIHWAFYKANRDAVDLLLEAGADPTTFEQGIYSIVDFAVRGQDEVLVNKALKLLFDAGADMQEVYDEGLNAAMIVQDKDLARKFLMRVARPDSAGPLFCFGFPPLVKAARAKDKELVELLVRFGARAGLHLPEVQALIKQEDEDE
ncbi:MAG: ankyrin repeat domain-containing protein, partial [Mailhella sp.]|nr:ankyrin repeat domain-containing protein [Mailhella sp.]